MNHPIAPLLKRFFSHYLPVQKGLSIHTLKAYRDSLKLLLCDVADRMLRSVDQLAIEDLTESRVLCFLDHVESVRGCSPSTRNARLAAIRSLFAFIGRLHPELLLQCRQVRLQGKGNKIRSCPLWPETVAALRAYLRQRQPKSPGAAALFLNANGDPITRFGIRYLTRKYAARAQAARPSLQLPPLNPHTLRHTTAMHLLRSGNDIYMVSYCLGHADLNTTHVYLEIDLETKRHMLEKAEPPLIKRHASWHKPDVLQWLDQLTKTPELCAATRRSDHQKPSKHLFNST